jgi:hypothetical protein
VEGKSTFPVGAFASCVDVKVRDYRMFELLSDAGRWPSDWPPLKTFYQAARNALRNDIDSAIRAMEGLLDDLVRGSIPELVEAIKSFNELIDETLRLQDTGEQRKRSS